MTNREEQIYKAADKATYQTPPQYSELVHKSRKAMCAYEVGFIDGCVWADQHPHWIPVEERLPEERKVVWVRKHFNKEVLGEFDIYDSAAFCNGEFQCDNSCTITHWMPIVPPRKEE